MAAPLKRALVLTLLLAVPVQAADLCDGGTIPVEQLKAAQAQEFEEMDWASSKVSQELALCLSEADPTIRDGLAYGGLTTLLRSGNLTPAEIRALRDDLYARLEHESEDGFAEPFFAIVLSEAARTDRIESYMSDAEFQTLVDQAAGYLSNVSDYRGYSDEQGWRHGVAHGADWAMQLILNARISAEQTQHLLDAVKAQVQAGAGHAYIHGEPSRLARPVLFAARQGDALEIDWEVWFKEAASPAPLESWNEAFQSEADLARLNNAKAFIQAIFVNAALTSNEAIQALKDPATQALITLP